MCTIKFTSNWPETAPGKGGIDGRIGISYQGRATNNIHRKISCFRGWFSQEPAQNARKNRIIYLKGDSESALSQVQYYLGAVAAVTATTRLLVILLLCNTIVNRFSQDGLCTSLIMLQVTGYQKTQVGYSKGTSTYTKPQSIQTWCAGNRNQREFYDTLWLLT